MKSNLEVNKALNSIRAMIDKDVSDCDIVDVDKKLKLLTQLLGLSAEANASAKKILLKKELDILKENKDSGLPPSVLNNLLKAECFEESALLEYADRLNSGLVHCIDGLRSSVSLYKTELSTGMINLTNP
jgi:hypothetical protein